ncbi:MAG: hypothetical protein JWN99_709 [Ilumatobacteraceae bacterium]|nr:hypothetical protein [Ilumatobacteraceae bacterium]
MNPLNGLHRRTSMRLAMAGAVALSLVALPACGSDDNSDTPATVFDTVAPVDNSSVSDTPAAPGDTTTVGSMAPGAGSVAP